MTNFISSLLLHKDLIITRSGCNDLLPQKNLPLTTFFAFPNSLFFSRLD